MKPIVALMVMIRWRGFGAVLGVLVVLFMSVSLP
jgi:hypothetical protein